MKKKIKEYSFDLIKINDGFKDSYLWIKCEEKNVEDIFVNVLKIIKKIKNNVER